ncbi:VP6 [Warrego virus]|uniref:VP6 n=1 Tax=Warrego virus TaxID=40062 RepID=A0A097I4H5_9REOV|nr:VP6 [Warrego virus]AIT55721.1 VP6 [Warrego virus]
MSSAVLLAPGDVIRASLAELKERQITYHLKEWDAEKGETSEKTEDTDGLGSGGETEKEKDTGSKEGDKQDTKGDKHSIKSTGCQRGEKEKGGATEPASSAKNGNGKAGNYVVLTEDISKLIQQKYGTNVDVFKEGTTKTVLYLEKHVQKELNMDREQTAEQQERVRDAREWIKRQKGKKKDNMRIKKQQKGKEKEKKKEKGRKGKKEEKEDGDEEEGEDEEKGSSEKKEETDEQVGEEGVITILSVKKLLNLIGANENKREVVSARAVGVRLVSNAIEDVKQATAYFTSSTGDPNWKEVARKAAENPNIMAYVSKSDDPKKEMLHLIDHL